MDFSLEMVNNFTEENKVSGNFMVKKIYLFLGFPGSSAGKESLQCRRPWFDFWVGKIPWRRDRLPTPVYLGFSCGSAGKGSTCNAGDLDLIPGLGRSPGEGEGYPLQYSGLESSMDYIVHGVTKSQTRLSDFHSFSFHLFSKTILACVLFQVVCYICRRPWWLRW